MCLTADDPERIFCHKTIKVIYSRFQSTLLLLESSCSITSQVTMYDPKWTPTSCFCCRLPRFFSREDARTTMISFRNAVLKVLSREMKRREIHCTDNEALQLIKGTDRRTSPRHTIRPTICPSDARHWYHAQEWLMDRGSVLHRTFGVIKYKRDWGIPSNLNR